MPRDDLIQLRHGPAATWTSTNPVLDLGEPGVETDTGKQKIGDGSTAWNSLPYTGDGVGGSWSGGTPSSPISTGQARRGSASAWSSSNPILALGEFGWETDTNRIKMGDGASHWNGLQYLNGELEGPIAYTLAAGFSGGGGTTPLIGNNLGFSQLDGLSQDGAGKVTGWIPGVYAIHAYTQHISPSAGDYSLKPLCSGSGLGSAYGGGLTQRSLHTTGSQFYIDWSGTLSIDANFAMEWLIGSGAGDSGDAKIFYTRIGRTA